jgi:hypothetical protein
MGECNPASHVLVAGSDLQVAGSAGGQQTRQGRLTWLALKRLSADAVFARTASGLLDVL